MTFDASVRIHSRWFWLPFHSKGSKHHDSMRWRLGALEKLCLEELGLLPECLRMMPIDKLRVHPPRCKASTSLSLLDMQSASQVVFRVQQLDLRFSILLGQMGIRSHTHIGRRL